MTESVAVFTCEFCGDSKVPGFRCLTESAARYCPDAPTLEQIAAHEAHWGSPMETPHDNEDWRAA